MFSKELMNFQAAMLSLRLRVNDDLQPVLSRFMEATINPHIERDKVFLIDNVLRAFEWALRIGHAEGTVWTCSDSTVVHEIGSAPTNCNIVQQSDHLAVTLLPENIWPEEVSKHIYSPLHQHIATLLQLVVASWAVENNVQSTAGIIIPDLKAIEEALCIFNGTADLSGPSTHGSAHGSTHSAAYGSTHGSTSGSKHGNSIQGSEQSEDISSVTTDDENDYASTSYLRHNLGGETMKVLPKLESLTFFPQDDDEHHQIYLNIGVCADEVKGIVRGVYVCLKHHSHPTNSPPVKIVVGGNIQSLDDLGKQMSENNSGLPYTLPDFYRRYGRENRYLHWPFRIAELSFNELRVLFKYCFMLAAEAKVHGYKNHRIRQNNDIEKQAAALCTAISKALKDGYSTVPREDYIGKLQRRLQFLADEAAKGRNTRVAGDAAYDALRTGLNELKDAPREVLENLDESNPNSNSVEEPPEFDLPTGSRTIRRQGATPRHSIRSAGQGSKGDQTPSPQHANTPPSRRTTLSPGQETAGAQASSPASVHTPTPRHRFRPGEGYIKVEGPDWASSVDSSYVPAAPSRHSSDTVTSVPAEFTRNLGTDLKLRHHTNGLDLGAELNQELTRITKIKRELGKRQSKNFWEKKDIYDSLGKIEKEQLKIEEALANIEKEKIKIRETLKEKEEDSDMIDVDGVMVQEALDLVMEAGEGVEDFEVKIPPPDWDMDSEMTE